MQTRTRYPLSLLFPLPHSQVRKKKPQQTHIPPSNFSYSPAGIKSKQYVVIDLLLVVVHSGKCWECLETWLQSIDELLKKNDRNKEERAFKSRRESERLWIKAFIPPPRRITQISSCVVLGRGNSEWISLVLPWCV